MTTIVRASDVAREAQVGPAPAQPQAAGPGHDRRRPSGDIVISGLTKHYGGPKVVEDLDLAVRDGEFISLLGPSGCGKTTTLRCIAGLERPDAGRISIGPDVMADVELGIAVPPNKRRLGMVFQSYALWPHMSVFGNVAYPLRVQRRPAREVARRVDEVLSLVGLGHVASRGASELSGGQQQRIALARALAGDPRVLLLDEPLSNLDAALRAHMRTELRRIHREIGRTAVYVTHDQLEAVTLSTRIAVMNLGRIQQIGAPREVFGTPANRWVAEFVGFDNFLDAAVLDVDGGVARVQPDGWPQAVASPVAAGPVTLRAGGRCVFAIRSTGFQAASAADPEGFDAGIDDAMYMGELTELSLNAYGRALKARMVEFELDGGVNPQARTIRLRISPHQSVALPCDP